jgi:hypothetical protein
MSYPAIYIALRGKTPHVRPRYIRPRPPAPAIRGAVSTWCGIPELPYAIRNSEFGNRDSGTGVQEIFMVRYFPS